MRRFERLRVRALPWWTIRSPPLRARRHLSALVKLSVRLWGRLSPHLSRDCAPAAMGGRWPWPMWSRYRDLPARDQPFRSEAPAGGCGRGKGGGRYEVRADPGRCRPKRVSGASGRRRRADARRRRHHQGGSRAGALAKRRLRRGGTRYPRLRLGLQVLGALLTAGLVWISAPKVLHRLDFFRIRRVEIAGLQYLPPSKVIAALELGSEASVFDDLSAAGGRVRALPGVTSAVVRPRLPGTLEIELVEAVPVALAPRSGGMALLDSSGKVLPFDPAASAPDLPVQRAPTRGWRECSPACRSITGAVRSGRRHGCTG